MVAESTFAPEPPPVIPPRFNADYLQNPAPAYPPLARRMKEQGRVLIRVLVSVDGLPERVELKTSSGSPRLDHSALETIRNWKFVPARQGGEKVAAWVVVPIAFLLDG
jgi:protein TonB